MQPMLAAFPTPEGDQQRLVQELERTLGLTRTSMRGVLINYAVRPISLVDEETLECERGLTLESMTPRAETIFFKGDSFCFSTREASLAHAEESLAEVWFDGDLLHMGTAGEMVAILDESARKQQMQDKTRLYSSVYCNSLGIEVPDTCEELGEAVSSRLVAEIKGVGSNEIEVELVDAGGLRLSIQNGNKRKVYTVIPAAGYSMREMQSFTDGKLCEVVIASNHKRVTETLWLPLSVKRYEYHSGNQGLPLIVEEMSVTSIEVNADYLNDPMVSLRPGAIIADSRWSNAPTANGRFLDYVLPVPIEKIEQEFARRAQVDERGGEWGGKSRLRQLVALVSGVFVGVALNTIIYKKRIFQSRTVTGEAE